MFGLKKKKKSKDKEPSLDIKEKNKKVRKTLKEELAKEKKRKEAKGSNIASLVVFGFTVLFGVVFWLYGRISQSGVRSLLPDFDAPSSSAQSKPTTNSDGLIIFEK